MIATKNRTEVVSIGTFIALIGSFLHTGVYSPWMFDQTTADAVSVCEQKHQHIGTRMPDMVDLPDNTVHIGI